MLIKAAIIPTVLILTAAHAQENPTGRITGRVVDALGEGVAAARVRLDGANDRQMATHDTLTDSDGMFVFSSIPLPPGSSPIRVTAESKGRTHARVDVDLDPDHPETWKVLRSWDAGTLRIRTVDETGAPIPGVAVLAAAPQTRLVTDPECTGTTDEAGALELDAVPLGALEVRTWKPGFRASASTLWMSDHGELVLTLKAGDEVELRVRVRGLPEGRESAVIVRPSSNAQHVLLPAPLDGAVTCGGSFALSSLPALDYDVYPLLDGHLSEPRARHLKPVMGVHEVEFTLQPVETMQVRGILRDTLGSPVAGATIRCRESSSSIGGTAITAEDGRFSLSAPFLGKPEVIFELVGGDLALRGGTARSGWNAFEFGHPRCALEAGKEYTLVAVRTADIRGAAVEEDGTPLRDRRLELHVLHGAPTPVPIVAAYARTLRDGSFTFPHVFPFDEPVRITLGPEEDHGDWLELKPGKRIANLEIRASRHGEIEGRIVGSEQAAVCGARVLLVPSDPGSGRRRSDNIAEVRVDREGRYRFTDIRADDYRVCVMGPAGKVLTQSDVLHLEPGKTLRSDLETHR